VYRNKHELNSAVYCTNGEDDAKRTALAAVRRAVPLPASPPSLPDVNGQRTLMEPWLFNDNGHCQRSFSTRHAIVPVRQPLKQTLACAGSARCVRLLAWP
jgi:protein TonB